MSDPPSSEHTKLHPRPRAIVIRRLIKFAIPIAIGLIFRFAIPKPTGISNQGWQLFAIFLTTIAGLISSTLPVGAWAFVCLTLSVISKTLTFKEAFAAFTNEIIWLIVVSFFFSRGFVKTGLGDRIAMVFVRMLGKSTLGLSYGLVLCEMMVCPAMPSPAARAGGIFLPVIKSLALSADSRPKDGSSRKLGAYLIQSQIQVSDFIYNYGWLLNLMRDNTKKELISPAATRFATAYLTLQSTYSLKQPLVEIFASSQWAKFTWAKKSEGKQVEKIILHDRSFWGSVAYAIKTTKPLVRVLRMTNSEKMPGIGFIYGAMDKAKEDIQANLGGVGGAHTEIWSIIDDKWEYQLHRHLHAAAFFLNPYYHYEDNFSNHPEVKLGLLTCMEKLIPNPEARIKADLQIDDFRNRKGLFGFAQAKLTCKQRSPADWWIQYGDETPELTSFAVKILSLTFSSSACERNWSTFNHSACNSSALFLTALAQNLLAIKFAEGLGVKIAAPWVTWFKFACFPALTCILATPFILYKIYPPETKNTPDAPVMAKKKLEQMGPVTRNEWIMVGSMLVTVALWTSGEALGIASVVAAMLGLSILLLLGVLDWDDCLSEKSAWDTLAWFGVLVGMATQLTALGVVPWMSTYVANSLKSLSLSWPAAFIMLQAAYFFLHYMFASQTAHAGALYPAFLAMHLASKVPAQLAALTLACNTSLFAAITHYSSGSAALYYGAGYVKLLDVFKLGIVMALINISIWGLVGTLWWKVLGFY